MSLQYTTDFVYTQTGGRIIPGIAVNVTVAVGNEYSIGAKSIGFAAAEALALGGVTTAVWGRFINHDATNYVSILNDAAEIARIPAGGVAQITLANITAANLKAQANTAAVLLEWAVFDAV